MESVCGGVPPNLCEGLPPPQWEREAVGAGFLRRELSNSIGRGLIKHNVRFRTH